MIGYVTLGTNNLRKSAEFYDELLSTIGGKRMMEGEKFIAWDRGDGGAGLGITLPFDGKAATVGNGVMAALFVKSPDEVKKIHAKALQLGGKDEGAPGPRGDSGFYAAYFRDLDGNKLNAFCMTTK